MNVRRLELFLSEIPQECEVSLSCDDRLVVFSEDEYGKQIDIKYLDILDSGDSGWTNV